jgi:thiamine biosynthesis lipoprotein
MGTVFRLIFYAEMDSSKAQQLAQNIFNRIDSLNGMFSDWLPESELNRLCAKAGNGQKTEVSKELFEILCLSKQFSRQSNGAFDVSIGPLSRLWRRARTLKEFPDSSRILEARSKVDWRFIETDNKTRSIELRKQGMGLDLGGIAQGWTADYCLSMLKNAGIASALVDAGGDIALGDPPPGKTGWALELPAGVAREKFEPLLQCGITTSGASFRFVEFDGVRYSHIIDPKTGRPLTHHILVTVKAKNAVTADAWATALSVLGNKGLRKTRQKRLVVALSEMELDAHHQ